MIRLLAILFLSTSVWALPGEVEIWFLSSGFQTSLIAPRNFPSITVAVNDCIPMGEGCFHPQFGYMEEDSKSDKKNKVETDRTIPDDGIDLIECKDKNYFNIFCANAKNREIKKFPRMEVWIDNSSSLRLLDPTDKKGVCHRSKLVSKLLEKCSSDRIGFSVYNTSIKQLGTPNEACNNYGSNNVKSLIRWIEGSEVKKLILITDLDEHTREFKNFLDSIGAIIQGVDSGSMLASQLLSMSNGLIASCKKIKPLKK